MRGSLYLMDKLINVGSPTWDPAASYGRVAYELKQVLNSAGYYVNQYTGDILDDTDPINPCIGGILLGWPSNFHKYGAMMNMGPRLAITMFESTELPPGWPSVLNSMDACVVPCTWNVEMFKENGVTVPLYKIPLGISEAFTFRQRPLDREVCTFVTIGDGGRRKGWMGAAIAFEQAFKERTDVQLLVKCRPQEIPFQFSNINIKVVSRDLTIAELADFYGDCDFMIFPTLGEGFALPPREFAATGGVAAATDWGGSADDIREWGMPIPIKGLVPAWEQTPELRGLGLWANPDLDALARMLHFMVDNRRAIYESDLPRFYSEAALHLYQWPAFGQSVLDIWERVSAGQKVG